MPSSHPTHALTAALLTLGLLLTAAAARAEEPIGAKTSSKQAPQRVVITDEAPVGEIIPLSSLTQGRPLPTRDAYGNLRGPDEARFVTGSFIKEKYELYGNSANTSVNVRVYTQGDLSHGRSLFGGSDASGGLAQPGVSYTDSVTRLAGNRYILDLRRVAPARRLQVATNILGEERGRKLVADFGRWEAAQSKRKLATR